MRVTGPPSVSITLGVATASGGLVAKTCTTTSGLPALARRRFQSTSERHHGPNTCRCESCYSSTCRPHRPLSLPLRLRRRMGPEEAEEEGLQPARAAGPQLPPARVTAAARVRAKAKVMGWPTEKPELLPPATWGPARFPSQQLAKPQPGRPVGRIRWRTVARCRRQKLSAKGSSGRRATLRPGRKPTRRPSSTGCGS